MSMQNAIESHANGTVSDKELADYLNRTGPVISKDNQIYYSNDGVKIYVIDRDDIRNADEVDVPASYSSNPSNSQTEEMHMSNIPTERSLWVGSYNGKTSMFKMEGVWWHEYLDNSGTPSNQFVQVKSDENYVYLFDNSRNMNVALGIHEMLWRIGDTGDWHKMYTGGWGEVA